MFLGKSQLLYIEKYFTLSASLIFLDIGKLLISIHKKREELFTVFYFSPGSAGALNFSQNYWVGKIMPGYVFHFKISANTSNYWGSHAYGPFLSLPQWPSRYFYPLFLLSCVFLGVTVYFRYETFAGYVTCFANNFLPSLCGLRVSLGSMTDMFTV